jgi:uncharacterized protein (TIGR00730 family)
MKSDTVDDRSQQATNPLELHFTRTNGSVDRAIDELIDATGGIRQREIVREIVLAALKAGQENGGRADLKLMNTSLKEMRFTAKVFGPYKRVRKVSVFGSARIGRDTVLCRMARDLGRLLAEAGYMVITGGGPGIMQAVNEGAGAEHSFGVNIRLPFEQKPNPVLNGSPRHITYKYFFNRKVAFLKEAHAVILFPGGFGTLDEALETLTLVQTGKRYPMPLLLIDQPSGTYWARCLGFFESELVPAGYIDRRDLDLLQRFESASEAVKRITGFYHRYHSMRYVGERLVLRLNTPLPGACIARLQTAFSDLLVPGGRMFLSGPLEEEANERDLARLPRLVVDFNRSDSARLRALIDAINACPPTV